MTRTLESMAGMHISEVVTKMVELADAHGEKVTADFNGFTLRATPGMTAGEVTVPYDKHCARQAEESRRKREAWLKTPEGQEAQRKEEERKRYLEHERAAGLPAFEVGDHDTWNQCIANNSDPYGACTVRYAARWANFMELAMANGESVKDCAKRCSHDADMEGITGFMYGCAVSILAQVWKHGVELRRWHNLDSQIGAEGDQANENGGVLNPALLSIGG